MCGIAATFSYQSNRLCDKAELSRIRDAMLTRGPDGSGLWISEDRLVGLGHRRLAIIDVTQAGAQPMWDRERSVGVVFNGEIYNYRELRSRLEQRGHQFQTQTDTEVLLHLYQDRGLGMFPELRGMFAIALWDGVRRQMVLARDPFGIKPLYYALDGGVLRAASQVRALLAGSGIRTEPDWAAYVGFLLWGHVPEPHTIYRHVRALAPGSCLVLEAGREPSQTCFCSVTDLMAQAARSRMSCDSKRTLNSALMDTIRHHLVADVPLGIFLSSGVDSSILLAAAAATGARELRTITLGFEEYRGTAADETPRWPSSWRPGTGPSTRRAGSRKRTLRPRGKRKIIDAMDQPTIDGVNVYFVSRAAKACGLTVALSGIGGDEMFGGYSTFRRIPHAVRVLSKVPMIGLLGITFRSYLANSGARHRSPKLASILEYGHSYPRAYLLSRSLFLPWEIRSELGPETFERGWEDLQPIKALEEASSRARTQHDRVACMEMTAYMRDQLLRDADWAGMAHSLEIRVPLVDIEFYRQILPLMASRHPPTKRDFAAALESPLPNAVLSRRKTGFSIPVHRWVESAACTQGNTDLRGWARHLVEGTFAPVGTSVI